MPWAKTAYVALAILMGVMVVVQFFLAGYGVLGGEPMGAHKLIGHLLEPLSLILVIFAALGRLGGKLIGMSGTLLVLVVLQSVWIDADAAVLRAFHVLGALSIAMILREIVANARPAAATVPAAQG
jgi:hypothetical protein